MNRQKAKVALPALAVAALAAVGIWHWSGSRDGEAPGTIAGNGTVEATEVDLAARVAGRLVSVGPREGDAVKKGQEVAVLDAAELGAQVEQARGNLAAAEAALADLAAGSRAEEVRRLRAQAQGAADALAQAQARLELLKAGTRREQLEQARAAARQARVAFEDAEREAGRVGGLAAQGAVPGRDLDQAAARRDGARAALDAADQRLAEAEAGTRVEDVRGAEAAARFAASQLAAAQAALDLAVAGPRRETIQGAEARVAAARGALAAAEALAAQTRIAAPIDGRVTLRNAEPGEVVTPGFPILRVADLDRVWLRVYVPEPRIGLLRTGQRAQVAADAFPGRRFPGVVTEIAEKPEFTPKNVQTSEERAKLVFGVKVEVENPGGELKPGMPADAVISVR
jgi:HlyD family secretion protein